MRIVAFRAWGKQTRGSDRHLSGIIAKNQKKSDSSENLITEMIRDRPKQMYINKYEQFNYYGNALFWCLYTW